MRAATAMLSGASTGTLAPVSSSRLPEGHGLQVDHPAPARRRGGRTQRPASPDAGLAATINEVRRGCCVDPLRPHSIVRGCLRLRGGFYICSESADRIRAAVRVGRSSVTRNGFGAWGGNTPSVPNSADPRRRGPRSGHVGLAASRPWASLCPNRCSASRRRCPSSTPKKSLRRRKARAAGPTPRGAVPTHHRVRLQDHHVPAPVRPGAGQPGPQHSVRRSQVWPPRTPRQDFDLMPRRNVFERQRAAVPRGRGQGHEHAHHHTSS